MLQRATIVCMNFEKGESITFYNEANIDGWEDEGYILVKKTYDESGVHVVMHKPSRVMITWIYQGREVTADKKQAIINVYEKKGKKIKRFTEAAFRRFEKDLQDGKIIPFFSKFRYGDIFFLPK